ncbi:MAG TPA: site-specific DNA-methyltransferase [Pyrinomonadaceae bacterium]|nr:site-specific DNA-methyltransferase [Pyrinomonadaceae bacterium]
MIELNTIYNENCIQTLERMSDDFLDMTLCSPPYDDLRSYNGYELPLEAIVHLLYRKTKPGGVVVWVVGDKTHNGSESLSSFDHAISFVRTGGFNLHDTMLYVKNNPIPSDCGKRYRQTFEYMFCFSKGTPKTFNPILEPTKSAGKKIKAFRITQDGRGNVPDEDIGRQIKAERKASNVFSYNVGTASATDRIAFQHPAIFPERLAEDQISTWTNQGDIVYDCFMGSGTTAVASCNQRRRYIGSEISQEYVDVANERLTMYRHKIKHLPQIEMPFPRMHNHSGVELSVA